MKTVNRHVMDLIDWDSGESFEHTDPEKYLWFCVMDRAFRDIGDEEVDQEDLEKWFFDTKKYEMGSFNWICDCIGFDRSAVRSRAEYFFQEVEETGKTSYLPMMKEGRE